MKILIRCRQFVVAICLATTISVTASAQSGAWIKSYPVDSVHGSIATQIASIEDSLILACGTVRVANGTTAAVTTIINLDSNGEVVWKREIPPGDSNISIDFPGELAVSKSSEFYVPLFKRIGVRSAGSSGFVTGTTGGVIHEPVFSAIDSFLIVPVDLHISSDGAHLLEVTQRLDKRTDNRGPRVDARIQKINLDGEVVWSKHYISRYRDAHINNSDINNNDEIYLAWRNRVDFYPYFKGMLTKIDSSGQVIWEKEMSTNESLSQPIYPKVACLPNGNIAYSWTSNREDFELQEAPPVIYFLSPDGNLLDSIAFDGNWRTLSRMYPLANGDLIGCGYAWSELGYSGWMIRVSGDGELLWERYIQDDRLSDETTTEFSNVTETDEGSIVGTGIIRMYGEIRDGGTSVRTWVVKLDADGCLDPGCTNDTIHLMQPVSIEPNLGSTSLEFSLSPNPTSTNFTLAISASKRSDLNGLTYSVFTITGQLLTSGIVHSGKTNVASHNWDPGLYIVVITQNGRIVATKRLVKQ